MLPRCDGVAAGVAVGEGVGVGVGVGGIPLNSNAPSLELPNGYIRADPGVAQPDHRG